MLKKVYFPNLNGVRFIAALLVTITHIEQIKSMFGLPNYWDGNRNEFIDIVGKLGVILFFVLSGFLITYLLLFEKKETGTIDAGEFYISRTLLK
jgi:peptidoglycan/LPS O-acetylase OafA/YrhL